MKARTSSTVQTPTDATRRSQPTLGALDTSMVWRYDYHIVRHRLRIQRHCLTRVSGNAAEGSLHLRQKPTEKGEQNLPSSMWEYRPWYQRGALAAGFLGFGGAACFFALTARKRRVLRLFVRHSQIPKQPSTVIIEGCDAGKRGKKVFPIQECVLGPGRGAFGCVMVG